MDKIKNWLIKFITAQAYISVISIPILAFWGLPLSAASFLGNLIVSPIVAVFIFLSSLLFFSQLLGIPNLLIIKLIEANSWIILKFVSLGSSSWLIGLQQSYFLFLIPIIASIIIFKFKDRVRMLLLLTLLFLGLTFAKLIPKAEFSETIKCRNSKALLTRKNSKTKLYCKASIGRNNPGLNNWVEYKLLPILYKNTGCNQIDTAYFDKEPSDKTIPTLEKHISIGKIKIK